MAIVSINMNGTSWSIPDVIQHMIVIRNLVRRLFVKKTAPSSRWRRHGASFASNGAPSANDGAPVTSGGARLGGDGALSPVTAPLSPVTSGRRPRRSGCAPQRNALVLWEFLRTPLLGAPLDGTVIVWSMTSGVCWRVWLGTCMCLCLCLCLCLRLYPWASTLHAYVCNCVSEPASVAVSVPASVAVSVPASVAVPAPVSVTPLGVPL